jgi:hypothetical protein
MATIDGLGLQEPSTITKSLAVIPITRNSSVTYQEIMTIGSPNSTGTLALAEVLGSAPASTVVGLAVRQVGPVTIQQSTAGDLNVTVANLSTTATVRQSSAADLQATITPAAGSTFRTQPGSTAWASSAGFHFDSSGALQVTGATASTGVTVNRLIGNSSAADSVPVRIVNSSGDGFLAPGNEYTHGSTYSSLTGPALTFDNGSNATMRMVGVLNPLPTQLFTSSGASVMDSTESAIKVNVVAGAAGGSTTATVRQSSFADLNALSRIADRDQSTQVAAVLNAAPVSTTYGLVTRDLSTGPFAISSIAGPVTMRSSAANALITAYQSSAADLQATVTLASTGNTVTARVTTSSGGGVEGSTTAPAVGVTGLHVRQVFPTMQSTTIVITSTNSTAIYPVISSAAGVRHKVYAYFVGSTHTNPSTLIFCSSASGSDFHHWAVNFGSGSSGVTGANLALTPPGYIFAGVTANALNVKVEGGSSAASTVVVRVALAWFDEA